MFSRGALHHQPGSASPQGRILISIPCCKYGLSFAVKLFLQSSEIIYSEVLNNRGIPIQPLQIWLSGSPWVQWSATCKAEQIL